MAVKKLAGRPKPKKNGNELGKLLSTQKVLRIVSQIGGDKDEFAKLYLADNTRVRSHEFSDEEKEAIQAWLSKPNSLTAREMAVALGVGQTAAFKLAMLYSDMLH